MSAANPLPLSSLLAISTRPPGYKPSKKPSAITSAGGDPNPCDCKRAKDSIEEAGLSPYAYRLIGHLSHVADDELRTVKAGVRPLAKSCKMSAGKIVSAKKELESKGLIKVIIPGNPKTCTPDTIKLMI